MKRARGNYPETSMRLALYSVLLSILALSFAAGTASAKEPEESAEKTAEAVAREMGGDVTTDPEKGDDFMFRALRSEMTRTTDRLKLGKYQKPYFVQYKVIESDVFYAGAAYGAVTRSKRRKSRTLYTDIRIGDYDLDSSRPATGFSLFGSRVLGGGRKLSVEDDYYAVRQEIWLASDKAYKKAIENFEAKKAQLKANPETDRLGDLTKEKPVVFIKPAVELKVDRKKWEDLTRKLSAIFLKYPEIEQSFVSFSSQAGNAWLINNEGFKHRDGKLQTLLSIAARIRAADGRQYSDVDFVTTLAADEMPSYDELAKRTENLVARLKKVISAPLAKGYNGPIMFTPEAAAPLMYSVLSKTVAGAHEKPEGGFFSSVHPLKNKIGQRVASRIISVVDDPWARKFKGEELFGGYEADDDGIMAKKIKLIDRGVLKTFCTGRVPTRGVDGSNGHCGNGVGTVSILKVSADPSVSAKKLKKKLIALGKEQGYEKVYIVRRMAKTASWLLDAGSALKSMMSKFGGGLELYPTELYRVSVKNGKEELVRGAKISVQPARVLRDITAAGNDRTPVLVAHGPSYASSVVVPSILVRDVDVLEPSKRRQKPPVVANPLLTRPGKK